MRTEHVVFLASGKIGRNLLIIGSLLVLSSNPVYKNHMNKISTLSLALFFGCLAAFGQESREEFFVGFRVGSGMLDREFADNAARLADMISFLEDMSNDSTVELTAVIFSGSASPEGGAALNRQLAEARMSVLESYVRSRVPLPDSIVKRRPDGIAWNLLAELVDASVMPGKSDVLHVLRNVPERIFDSRGRRIVDSRKKRLMNLHRGRSWHYMDRHFFVRLRGAMVILKARRRAPSSHSVSSVSTSSVSGNSDEPPAEPPAATDSDLPASSDTLPEPIRKSFYMSARTNMLYDVMALPTIGVEFFLCCGWSIAASWTYGWWNSDRLHRYWRAYGGEIAVRRWFGEAAERKPFTGHHLGVYGQILTYDFEFGGKGRIGGTPGKPLWSNPNYAVGVEYGYSLSVARRLNIDFTIGIGYLGGKYYEYMPIDGHYVWQSTMRCHWLGPTKAEISLIWLIGRGNCNSLKEGGGK